MVKIPSDVEAILKKQKLVEVTNVSSHYHNYASICLNRKKEIVYIKIRLYPELVSHKSFIKEVIFTKFLSENFFHNKFFITPKYYKSEIVKKPEWMIRGYTNGKRMGDVWGFGPEFIKQISPKEIADFLDFVRSDISKKFKKQKKDSNYRLFEKNTAATYKKYFTDYLLLSKKFIKAKQKKKVLEIFDKYGKFLEKNNNYLAHGDLHPGNFVYNKGKIVVHDWKYAHLDNPYIDLAFMWFLLWLNEGWREKLFALELKRAENKEVFLKCFFLSILKLAPKMITIFMQSSHVSEKNRKKGIAKILTAFNQAIKYLGCRGR
ncbi:phosphotransferase [Patescibacteria group bacterium]|nr:phosphotransferase [Patescibacteria group bacterium]